MRTASTGLAGELRSLRRGRGILVERISERAGPALRNACGVDGDDPPARIRTKIALNLRASIGELPDDLRDLMLTAFAISADARHPRYQDRVGQAALRLKKGERTVRRRIDEGISLLAEIMGGRPAPDAVDDRHDPGWHTAELHTLLNLQLPVPEAFELRRVVAEREGLRRLDLAHTVATPLRRDDPEFVPEPDIDVFSGGTLVGVRRESAERVGFELELPRPLRIGEVHEYALRFRLREGRQPRPRFVCVPRYRCDRYRLRVRFGPGRPPAAVWRLRGAFPSELDAPPKTIDWTTVDSSGEVFADFRNLGAGLAYGFRWAAPGT